MTRHLDTHTSDVHMETDATLALREVEWWQLLGDDGGLLERHQAKATDRRVDGLVAEDLGARLGSIAVVEGAGKSTLLRALVGLLPSSGDVRIAGHLPSSEATRAAFDFAPAEPALDENLSLAEHSYFIAALYQRPEAEAVIRAWLGAYALGDELAEIPDGHSGGMRQKLGLDLALGLGMPLTMLDEPFNGLDADAQETLRAGFVGRTAEGGAVLLNGHQQELPATLGARLWLLEKRVKSQPGHLGSKHDQPRHRTTATPLDNRLPGPRPSPVHAKRQPPPIRELDASPQPLWNAIDMAPRAPALLQYLSRLNPGYSGKLDELRDAVARWLEYIPSTFPHFTRHGISHSDQIIQELSNILFHDGASEPTAPLSAMEVYVLCSAAYLHDAGMVISDREKREILGSPAWRSWTTTGGGARRWEEVRALQAHAAQGTAEDQFLADVQTRYLIAEFARRVHHTRVVNVLATHHRDFANFAFSDQAVLTTVSDICTGHGLDSKDLEDPIRFPDRRTLRGELVNIRFIALLLRLGDLLDMSSERACPFVMSAAAPLPADSIGHWLQYHRIVHRVVAPDLIELRAKCHTQDEHYLLLDWCSWLKAEVDFARTAMARVNRHRDWVPPYVSLDGQDPTIIIEPAEDAAYAPHRWRLELDAPAVLERLIKDAHAGEYSFMRELLQNALDASRTQMYIDLAESGAPLPDSPTKVPQAWRERYPIRIEIAEQLIANELSAEDERRQVVSITDVGIGMDEEAIRRYFLQVGRSYYTSPEFRDHFPFVATSRFGIGFLSVFSVSDYVEVETCRRSSATAGSGIRLTVTGPRSHFLTERVDSLSRGTRISVRLRTGLDVSELVAAIVHWCKRVEFPLQLKTESMRETISNDVALELRREENPPSEAGNALVVHTVPVDENGVEGSIFILALLDAEGESWAERRKVEALVRRMPNMLIPHGWLAYHGLDAQPRWRIRQDETHLHGMDSMIAQLDVRGGSSEIPLNRSAVRFGLSSSRDLLAAVEPAYTRLLDAHLEQSQRANSADGWRYKQALSEEFPLRDYWWHVPDTVKGYRNGDQVLVSLGDALAAGRLALIVDSWLDDESMLADQARAASIGECDLAIVGRDVWGVNDHAKHTLFGRHRITDVRLKHGVRPIVMHGADSHLAPLFTALSYADTFVVDFPSPDLLVLSLSISGYMGPVLLNSQHAYTPWIRRLIGEIASPGSRLTARAVRKCLDLVVSAAMHSYPRAQAVADYVEGWRSSSELPNDLTPPSEPFRADWIGKGLLVR